MALDANVLLERTSALSP